MSPQPFFHPLDFLRHWNRLYGRRGFAQYQCVLPLSGDGRSVQRFFEVLTRHRPTIFFGVPTLYAGMLAQKDAERKWDLSSLRLCVSAGEALPDEIYARWKQRFGVEIIDGIGTTEILHIFLSNRPGAARPTSGLPERSGISQPPLGWPGHREAGLAQPRRAADRGDGRPRPRRQP